MGGHDAELILIAGGLLAAGILGALLADRVRIPGLLLFLGLGHARRLGGDRRDRVRRRRAGADAGHDRPRPDPLRGRPDRGLVGDPPRARHRRLAGDGRDRRHRLHRRARRALDLRHQRARRDDRRRRDRRHRLGRDLRRAAPFDPREAPRPLARGRVGDERPGRAAAGDRLHRMDPGARLRARRHGRPAGAQTGDRDRRSAWRSGRLAVAALDRVRLPTDGIYPVATIAIAGARLRPGRGRPRLRPARRLPDRAGARLGAGSRRGARSSPSTRASAGSPRSASSSCSACSSSPARWATSPGRAWRSRPC